MKTHSRTGVDWLTLNPKIDWLRFPRLTDSLLCIAFPLQHRAVPMETFDHGCQATMQRDNTEWWAYPWKCLTFGFLATREFDQTRHNTKVNDVSHVLALVWTDMSEEHSDSVIRVTRIGDPGTTLAETNNQRTLQRNAMYIPPKRRFLQQPQGVTSQKTTFFIVTVVKTSDPAWC
jgi:hypothetical protein